MLQILCGILRQCYIYDYENDIHTKDKNIRYVLSSFILLTNMTCTSTIVAKGHFDFCTQQSYTSVERMTYLPVSYSYSKST